MHVFELFLICAFCPSISLEGGDEVISTWDEAYESFDGMGLHENLLRGIYAYGKTPISFRLSIFEQHRAVVIRHLKCFFLVFFLHTPDFNHRILLFKKYFSII